MMVPLISTLFAFAAGFCVAYCIGTAWDAVSRRWIADLQPLLTSLSIEGARLNVYLRGWGLALLGTFIILGVVLQMWPVAVAVGLLLFFAPRWILQWVIARRRLLLRDQMVGATVALANACRAGLSLAQGLDSVSREAAPPLATELGRVVREYEHGRPLAEAIADVRDRLQLDSFTLFASAILVSLERGGPVTEALERISHSLQEHQRVERKLEAETASGKRVVWILAAFPFVFLGGFYLLYPSGTAAVFQSLIGQFVLLGVIGLVCASVWWSNRILAVEL